MTVENMKGRDLPICRDMAPAGYQGHWKDWHRGHGCNRDPDAVEMSALPFDEAGLRGAAAVARQIVNVQAAPGVDLRATIDGLLATVEMEKARAEALVVSRDISESARQALRDRYLDVIDAAHKALVYAYPRFAMNGSHSCGTCPLCRLSDALQAVAT